MEAPKKEPSSEEPQEKKPKHYVPVAKTFDIHCQIRYGEYFEVRLCLVSCELLFCLIMTF